MADALLTSAENSSSSFFSNYELIDFASIQGRYKVLNFSNPHNIFFLYAVFYNRLNTGVSMSTPFAQFVTSGFTHTLAYNTETMFNYYFALEITVTETSIELDGASGNNSYFIEYMAIGF